MQRVIAAIAPTDSAERFAGLGVRVIKGHAKFKDRRTVIVGDDYEIRARRFVIATGSTPALPPIPGLDEGPYLTNETVFDLTELPDRLIVIGAGPIGLEMAQAFRRLGSAVTVLEAATPLAKDDPECAAIVLDQLEREGVVIRSGVKVVRVKHANGSVAVTYRRRRRRGDHRRPLSAGRRRPQADDRRARSRCRRHQVRPLRHLGEQEAQDRQPARLCDRRCRGGTTAVHPRRQLSRRPGDPERAVPPSGQA